MEHKKKSLLQRIGVMEIIVVLLIAAGLIIPFVTTDLRIYSLANQIMIAIAASFSVYIMMRMNLLTFAVPAFMAFGGYGAAIAGLRFGVTDVFVIAAISFLTAAFCAMLIGILVLRLRGVYFVLVTFLLSQVTLLAIFELPELTGGSAGLVGMPALTLFGIQLAENRWVLVVTISLTLVAALITVVLTRMIRQQLAAIETNELLAQSLGLAVWRYKLISFMVAGGISGLAGLALVNMLLMAHPSSFEAFSALDYIVYTIVGGQASIVGPVIGSAILVWATDALAEHGEYSELIYGVLIIVVMSVARDGIVGLVAKLIERLRDRHRDQSKVSPRVSEGKS